MQTDYEIPLLRAPHGVFASDASVFLQDDLLLLFQHWFLFKNVLFQITLLEVCFSPSQLYLWSNSWNSDTVDFSKYLNLPNTQFLYEVLCKYLLSHLSDKPHSQPCANVYTHRFIHTQPEQVRKGTGVVFSCITHTERIRCHKTLFIP